MQIKVGEFDQRRTDRQERLPWWDQDRVSQARILLVGAGALGNEVIKNLAQIQAGTTKKGEILVVDNDVVMASNLNRCIFFQERDSTESQHKVAALKRNCERLFPSARIRTYPSLLEDLIDTVLQKKAEEGIDVAVSGLDNIGARLTLNSFCFIERIPLVDGGIEGMFGRERIMIPPKGPCLNCEWGNLPIERVMGKFGCPGSTTMYQPKMANLPTVNSVIAAMMIQDVIKIIHLDNISDRSTPRHSLVDPSRILVFDGWTNCITVQRVKRDPGCIICTDSRRQKDDR